MMEGVVYVSPEGVRVREMERLFEVLPVDVVKYEEKSFDVIVMEDFNVRIGLGAEEHPNSNGKRLLELVRVGDLSVGIQLQCCDDRWTREGGVRMSVIDYMLFGKAIEVVEMVVEDSEKLNVGSDHNLIWSEVI